MRSANLMILLACDWSQYAPFAIATPSASVRIAQHGTLTQPRLLHALVFDDMAHILRDNH